MATPYQIAASMAGSHEGQAALTDFLRTGGQNIDPTTRAWCADFVNATLSKAGTKGTDSGMARSFMNWGQSVVAPQIGDIAVFSRGDPNGPSGHVGFYAGTNPNGTIKVLGGNQSDSVSYANLPASRLLGYRRAGGDGPSDSQPATPLPGLLARKGALGSMAPQSQPSIPVDVARYAASDDKQKPPLQSLLQGIGEGIPTPKPPPAGFSGGSGPGNQLLKYLSAPTVADIFLKKRMGA